MNASHEIQDCSYVQQAVCASKYIKMFEYNKCSCAPECDKGKDMYRSMYISAIKLRKIWNCIPPVCIAESEKSSKYVVGNEQGSHNTFSWFKSGES